MSAGNDQRRDAGGRLLAGAQTYDRVLSDAGGRELSALPLVGNGVSVYAAVYRSPPYTLSVPPLDVPRLAVNLTPARVSGGIEGDRSRCFEARRHSLFLTPAGEPVRWHKESASRHLSIYFRPDVFDGAEETPSLARTPALFNAAVPGIGLLIDDLAREFQSPDILDAEAVDSLSRLLLIRLARHLHAAATAPNALTAKVVARLRDFASAHLSERILVADLARQTGLSPNRFAMGFTEFTGQSPHQFVLALRVERAAELLVRTDSSLVEIAHACGFASQQHMNNAMRRQLGTTPSRVRALRQR